MSEDWYEEEFVDETGLREEAILVVRCWEGWCMYQSYPVRVKPLTDEQKQRLAHYDALLTLV